MNTLCLILVLIFSFQAGGSRSDTSAGSATAGSTGTGGTRAVGTRAVGKGAGGAGTGRLEGTVVSVGATAVRADWTPPALKRVSTVVLLDSLQRPLREVSTDRNGRFRISAKPGTYFLLVKESFIPAPTGPFVVRNGKITRAKAHFDNGVR